MLNLLKNYWGYPLGIILGSIFSYFIMTNLSSIQESAPALLLVLALVLFGAFLLLQRFVVGNSWKKIIYGSIVMVLGAILIGFLTGPLGSGVPVIILRLVLNGIFLLFVSFKFFLFQIKPTK